MRDARGRRRTRFVRMLLGLVAVVALAVPGEALAGYRYPTSMASTGDSITRAYNTGFFPYVDNPAGSWSTGTTTSVSSHYLRLLAHSPKLKGHNFNDARSGAKMADLQAQMATVVAQQVGYVTV